MWRKFGENFADFRPSISKRSGRKKSHEKVPTNSASCETRFFHCETLGAWGLWHFKPRCGLKMFCNSDLRFGHQSPSPRCMSDEAAPCAQECEQQAPGPQERHQASGVGCSGGHEDSIWGQHVWSPPRQLPLRAFLGALQTHLNLHSPV